VRTVNNLAQAHRERRLDVTEATLAWITAKNRDTGAPESLGLSTGTDVEVVRVTDLFSGVVQDRSFVGRGSLLSIGEAAWEVGLDFRPVRMVLSAINPDVETIFRAYEPVGAKVQVWKRALDPLSGIPFDAEPWFKGYVNRFTIVRPAPDGAADISVDIVSTKRMLTIPGASTKSDAAHRARFPTDLFRSSVGAVTNWTNKWYTKVEK
jgi:hypothetical protein